MQGRGWFGGWEGGRGDRVWYRRDGRVLAVCSLQRTAGCVGCWESPLPLMITEARFENFKLLRKVDLRLGRFQVVVGGNGSGKSSILEGLHYLLQVADAKGRTAGAKERLPELFRGEREPKVLCSWPLTDSPSFSLGCTSSDGLHFAIRWAKQVSLLASLDAWSVQEDGPPSSMYSVPKVLPSVVRLRLEASRLAADHYSEDEKPRIEYDGTGLASVVQELQGARDGRFDQLEADLRKVVPAAKRIRTVRAKITRREKIRITVDGQESWSEQLREFAGARIEVEWGDIGWIPARHLSEGTLLALGLCAVVHHEPPSLVLLDDLDKGLHPKAQRDLVAMLRAVCDARPGLQILATTHSPFVVDEFAPADVLVVASVDGKSSQVRLLSEHPNMAGSGQYLETGEFWSAVGETWVVGKTP